MLLHQQAPAFGGVAYDKVGGIIAWADSVLAEIEASQWAQRRKHTVTRKRHGPRPFTSQNEMSDPFLDRLHEAEVRDTAKISSL